MKKLDKCRTERENRQQNELIAQLNGMENSAMQIVNQAFGNLMASSFNARHMTTTLVVSRKLTDYLTKFTSVQEFLQAKGSSETCQAVTDALKDSHLTYDGFEPVEPKNEYFRKIQLYLKTEEKV